ncbi:methylated-DNA--[protein]-cysteine S-methyltransferase [Terrabacter aerolatus]|uniref:Methylated-DNA--protein-cysteine methyltransferase n=1 Tax=Terrabacter aerolatus TaxID=422442 RepID=A0A512D6D3_9MICO|nr:methylated-DNA--[protein]-cysteine S-methyltransferase [Terrabacter aerolatus]GEO32033.1 methylated-DNA--protein-cysteine methyltransferase [Terrabacter aerolatus]
MSDNPIQLLTTSSPGDDERLASLHATLVERASGESSLDASYRVVDSPVGPLLLAATAKGVVRVAFEVEDHDRVLESLGASVGSRILRGGTRLDALARELDDYFAGRRHAFDVSLDLRLARGFRLTVLRHLSEIPYGSTESYGEVAVASGSPRAVRAVGSACATNPLPIVVPCHRVVRSDGSLGGYLGGLPAKERLLALERAA